MSVISHIYSGLGNQLFQYAAGRFLALKLNTDLRLDLSNYVIDKLIAYDLDKFNIVATVATDKDLKFYKQQPANLVEKLGYVKWRLLKRPVFVKEKAFHFENELATAKKNT